MYGRKVNGRVVQGIVLKVRGVQGIGENNSQGWGKKVQGKVMQHRVVPGREVQGRVVHGRIV